MCLVLNDYSDDPDTSAYMAGQNVLRPAESARQTLLTPTACAASAAVDTKKGGIFDVHAMDDNDEPMVERDRSQDRLEQRAQERNVPWYAVWNCFAKLSETRCITGQGKECASEHA